MLKAALAKWDGVDYKELTRLYGVDNKRVWLKYWGENA